MDDASDLLCLVLMELSTALMERGECEAGEKIGYDCWPSSMVKPITSTRPYRQVRKHLPRKHRVCRRVAFSWVRDMRQVNIVLLLLSH